MRETRKLMASIATLCAVLLPSTAFASWDETVYSKTVNSGSGSFGRTDANGKAKANYWKANLNTWVCAITFARNGKQGSPTDSVTIKLMKGGTSPANASTIEATALSAALWTSATYKWQLTNCYAFAKDEKLWITFERSGTQSDTNYYYLGYDASASGNATSTVWSQTSSWSDWNKQPYVVIHGTQGASSTLPIALLQMEENPTSTSLTMTCPDFGYVITPLCDATLYLLYPNFSSIIGKFETLASTTKSVVPFALIFLPEDASLTATGTTIGTISIDKDLLNATGSAITFTQDVTLFSSSTIRTYLGETPLTLFRTLMGIVTYAIGLSFVMYKIKEII